MIVDEDALDGRQTVAAVKRFTELASSNDSSQEDVHSRVSAVSGPDCTSTGGRFTTKTTPIQLKSPAGSSASSLRSGRDAIVSAICQAKSIAPPPPVKFDAVAARSIYDRDPEHCYENVEKVLKFTLIY